MPGKIKIFLGYAPGVGKAKVMVEEARRRKQRGEDCVLAILSEGDRLIGGRTSRQRAFPIRSTASSNSATSASIAPSDPDNTESAGALTAARLISSDR